MSTIFWVRWAPGQSRRRKSIGSKNEPDPKMTPAGAKRRCSAGANLAAANGRSRKATNEFPGGPSNVGRWRGRLS
ncbi:MAG: hypothetical protein Q8P67_04165 [archaeon]|nr:hypothetical protein [archaeon]